MLGTPASEIMTASSPVVIYSDGLGDTLMSLPTLRALSKFLDNRAIFIGSAASLEMLQAEDIGKGWVERLESGEETATQLGKCDLLITADPSRISKFSKEILDITDPRWSVGWSAEHKVMLPSVSHLHFSDEVFQQALFFDPNGTVEAYSSPPRFALREYEFAAWIRKALSGYRLLALHYETSTQKSWPIEAFRRLVEGLLCDFSDLTILVVGTRKSGLDVVSHSDRVMACEGLPLAKSMALVGYADAFVGVDSAMLHVADLFRVPTVGIFGPTNPKRWGCRFARHQHVCAPAGCLENLENAQVMVAVSNMISS